ncbi:MAG TPA: DUF1080 domain-containing protein [Candidatus Limnocylindria bacterium]|jgi:hypothetical protein|nr:DUF1080 domain-containing protein [Candidatus Limnocylindria bacterium]
MKALRIALLSLFSATALLAADAVGWETLFDGTSAPAAALSTAKWRGYRQTGFPAKGWVVEGGALKVQAGGGGGDLVTRDTYGSFELLWEWKVSEGANSGLIYHASEEFGASYETGLEYQLLDDAKHGDGKNPKTSAGALYALIAPNQDKQLRPVGEWNKSRLVIYGSHVQHWLNGKLIVQYDLASPELKALIAQSKFKDMPKFAQVADGHICLQDHGNDVWFRYIRVKRLEVK